MSSFNIDCGVVNGTLWNTVFEWASTHGYSFTRSAASSALDHPVPVDWYDAAKWCNARSEMKGRLPCYYTDAGLGVVYRSGQTDLTNDRVKWVANGYRLPTEAGWEKAAHGGLIQKLFPWGDRINQRLANDYANTTRSYDDGPDGPNLTYGGRTSPVGSPPQTATGCSTWRAQPSRVVLGLVWGLHRRAIRSKRTRPGRGILPRAARRHVPRRRHLCGVWLGRQLRRSCSWPL